MREYSNAFRHNGQYSKFVEIFESGVVYHGFLERRFIKALRDKYEMNVVFADYTLSNRQPTIDLYIYVDIEEKEITDDLSKELKTVLQNNWSRRLSLNNLPVYQGAIKAFGEGVINLFMQTFGYSDENVQQIFLHIEDFPHSCLARLYNTSQSMMRDKLRKIFGEDGLWRVLTSSDYDPCMVLVADGATYRRLQRKESRVRQQCYDIMKPHDHFDFLRLNDIRLRILLKSDLDQDTLNFYAREGLV